MVVALRQWGENWGHGTQDVLLADQRDGKPVRPIRVLADDGRELDLDDLIGSTAPPARSCSGARGSKTSSPAKAREDVMTLTRSRRPTGSGAAGRRR